MGRYLVTVGTVAVDAAVSGLTWTGDSGPTWLVVSAAVNGIGLVFAANRIADGLFTTDGGSPSAA